MPFLTDLIAADRTKLVTSALLAAALTYAVSLNDFKSNKKNEKKQKESTTTNGDAKDKDASNASADAAKKKKDLVSTAVKKDKSFFKVLMRVLKIGIGKREKMNMAALTTALFLRTGLSIFMNSHLGQTIGYFCNKDWQKVSDSVVQFAKISVFAAIVNASLHAFTDLLSYNLRATLTKRAHTLYKERMNFYNVNWVGKDVLENTDQLIAEDIEKFSDAFSSVYNQSLKPLVDFVLFSMQLASKLGPEGPFVLFVWFGIAGLISKKVLPPYGKLAAHEQLLEGRFRARHAALIKNAEMVSFMRGEEPETKVLDNAFMTIRKHQMSVLTEKFIADTIMGYLNKYFATVIGFLLTVRPVITNWNGMGNLSPGEIAAFFVSTRSTLEGLAASVLAIFELQKRIGQLSGLASRVDLLFDGLEKREPILEQEKKKAIEEGNTATRIISDVLKFDKVDVYKPDGVLLLKNLSITVPPKMRVIITGDNGCGKSSLFRVICGLWPLVAGTLSHPPPEKVYFLSQVNFVPVGTLREVLTYPHNAPKSAELDEKLREIMKWAHLEDLKCDGVKPSLDDALEWDTALSPGQKQRIAFARLFYANPQYAILDECTNGVAPDVEASLYERCAKMGMAIFSISHKIELKKLHDYELHYKADGHGGWEWINLREKEAN